MPATDGAGDAMIETVEGATIPVAAVDATTVLIVVGIVELVCRVPSSDTFLRVTSSYLPATNRDKTTLLRRIIPTTATFCWESHTNCRHHNEKDGDAKLKTNRVRKQLLALYYPLDGACRK